MPSREPIAADSVRHGTFALLTACRTRTCYDQQALTLRSAAAGDCNPMLTSCCFFENRTSRTLALRWVH
jgi:hypothetical protein